MRKKALVGRALCLLGLLGVPPVQSHSRIAGQAVTEAPSLEEAATEPPQAAATDEEKSAAKATTLKSALDPFRNLSGRGLLEIRDPFPLSVLHLQLPINNLELMEESDGKFEVNVSWANTFAVSDTVVVDAETYRLELSGWYAVRSDFYIGAGIPILARGGGILDPLVAGFHKAFN